MQYFPAAHSMDTYWFAVDAEGNVGFFDSGENGAVPSSIDRTLSIDYFIKQLPGDSRGIVNLTTDGSLAADGADLESLWKEIRYGGTMSQLLLVLLSEEVIEELLPHVRLRFSGSDTVVYIDECSAEKVKKLVESGKIIKGKSWFELFENTHLIGLFLYKHNWNLPAPYKRLRSPTNPLKLDLVSRKSEQDIDIVRFDSIRFLEVSEVQPIEHFRCNTWGGTPYWLDTKREREEWQKIRPEDKDFLE